MQSINAISAVPTLALDKILRCLSNGNLLERVNILYNVDTKKKFETVTIKPKI